MIEVRINPHDVPLDFTSAMIEMWCAAKLRDAGIPVSGFFIFKGVKSGKLLMFHDCQTNENVYQWKE